MFRLRRPGRVFNSFLGSLSNFQSRDRSFLLSFLLWISVLFHFSWVIQFTFLQVDLFQSFLLGRFSFHRLFLLFLFFWLGLSSGEILPDFLCFLDEDLIFVFRLYFNYALSFRHLLIHGPNPFFCIRLFGINQLVASQILSFVLVSSQKLLDSQILPFLRSQPGILACQNSLLESRKGFSQRLVFLLHRKIQKSERILKQIVLDLVIQVRVRSKTGCMVDFNQIWFPYRVNHDIKP